VKEAYRLSTFVQMLPDFVVPDVKYAADEAPVKGKSAQGGWLSSYMSQVRRPACVLRNVVASMSSRRLDEMIY